jgi:acyl carrier protein
MNEMDQATLEEIKNLVYDYFSDECDYPRDELTDQTNVIEDLEGDSLMLLSLLEVVRKKYALSIELKTLGKHLMKKPANTIGEIVTLTAAIVKHGDAIISIDL